MTDEEMAEKYESSKHYRYEDNDYCGDIADGIKQAFLAGLKAGKEMADADLATVAYMQGAERYKPKWHKVADGDLPKEKKLYLATTKEGSLILTYYNGTYWETKYDMSANGHVVEVIIAWCELPIIADDEKGLQ